MAAYPAATIMIVDVFTTLNSPWAYLGAEELARIRAKSSATFRIRPAKFAEVFAATGGVPLAQRPAARRAYRLMELKRWSTRRKVPLVLAPQHFPCDESAGVRLVMAAQHQGADGFRLAHEIGRSLWTLDQNFADEAVLAQAVGRAGLDLAALKPYADDVPARLAEWDANTQEALSRGVFGAPSFVLPSNEFFWGQDRLDFLAEAVGASS
jgi:2-hydroxychromene-2-carboxylate isomerase